jgi:tRNA threonylcarbamoyladenosine biosynthesis protein TsaB
MDSAHARSTISPVYLLAIDTSTPVCAVALHAGECAYCETAQAGNTHSQLALPMIEQLLAQAGIGFADLDAVAFGSGPGSFTGVRIACALAQGIAFAHGKLVVPVSTLASVAYTCGAKQPHLERIWVANDARMNEVYCAGYVRDGLGGWVESVPVRVCSPADALPPSGAAWGLAGDAFAVYPEMRPFPEGGEKPPLTAEGLLAASIAAFQSGAAIHPREAEPLYVRNKVAFTEAERALKKAAA